MQNKRTSVGRFGFDFLILVIAMLALAGVSMTAAAASLGSSFSFQGKLYESAQPANGSFEFEFLLFDAAAAGSQIGLVNTREEVAVTNGIFTVELDFGSTAFDGSARWLEIWVRSSNGDPAVVLEPRTPLNATPYALHATMAKSVSDGAITSEKLADGAVNGAKIAAGSVGGLQIASGAIEARHLSAGAVQSTHISAGAVGAVQIAGGAVGANHLANGAVTADKMGVGSAYSNLLSSGQSPIASGGVILSESLNRPELLNAGYVLISTVDLVSEAWRGGDTAPQPTPSVPLSLEAGPAVWTGTEMCVWGGGEIYGGRYNPATGIWSAMTTNNVPSKRSFNSAVWTGNDMIVWGGRLAGTTSPTATGARYHPASDTWTALPTANAPSARSHHAAVWTGTEMIVWGGIDASGHEVNSGARFNPASNTWTPLASGNAPSPRQAHTAVWDGTSMIVWGGGVIAPTTNETVVMHGFPNNIWYETNKSILYPLKAIQTGARYNPANNTWSAVSMTQAPVGRASHTAVWDGTGMIVWGGEDQTVLPLPPGPSIPLGGSEKSWSLVSFEREDGARYNPANNTWTPISTGQSPGARVRHTAVWTGSRMIVWGGKKSSLFNRGASYDPIADEWNPIAIDDQPSSRNRHSAVWTGSRMLIWGGGRQDSGAYDPAQDTWTETSPTADSSARLGTKPVWTGKEMIIWGGTDANGLYLQSGLRYDPSKNVWNKLPIEGAPTARANHVAVWTGTEMVVWGGSSPTGDLNDGARYNPATDTWTSISSTNAPDARRAANVVWTGQEVVVVGGLRGLGVTWDGGRYNPTTDTWMSLDMLGAPSPRLTFAMQWTGAEIIIWGGDSIGLSFNDGARFNPATGVWTPMSTLNAPEGRRSPTTLWTGRELLVWGGGGSFGNYPAGGGRYNPATDTWTPISTVNAPSGREGHSFVWDGSKAMVFGGERAGIVINSSTLDIYDPEQNAWSSRPSQETPRSQHTTVWTGIEMLVWSGLSTTQNLLPTTRLYRPARTFYLYLRP